MKRVSVYGFNNVGGVAEGLQMVSGFIAGDFEESFDREVLNFCQQEINKVFDIKKLNDVENSRLQTAIFNQAVLNGNLAAFTLAEVLITLGIIGVVAAITMPVLLTNVQSRVKAKRVENIKQKLSKVTDKMAVQSGLNGYGTTEAFVNEMIKQMKVLKVCDNSHIADCWPTKEVKLNADGETWEISKTKNSKTLQIGKDIRDSWDDTVSLVTADGIPMILSYKKDCGFDIDSSGLIFDKNSAMSNSMGCLSGVFDWNGGKNPNKLGDDILVFGKAVGLGNECLVKVGDKCVTAGFLASPLSKADCEARKDELGIKNCPVDRDYWAGAVAECGGVQNLPTLAESAKIASWALGVNVGTYSYVYINKSEDVLSRLSALGFSLKGEAGFWSNEEDSSYFRYFYASDYYGNTVSDYYRSGNQRGYKSSNLAICVSK